MCAYTDTYWHCTMEQCDGEHHYLQAKPILEEAL